MESVLLSIYPIQTTRRSRAPGTHMQVLALGLSRSGTDSLRAALEELGLKTYHGFSTTDDGAGDAVIWCNLLRRKYKGEGGERERGDCLITKEEFDIVLGESEAVTDMPCAALAYELIQAYPEAKVILNTRPDVDAWYESMLNVIVSNEERWLVWLISRVSAELFWVRRMWTNSCHGFFYHGSIRNTAKWVSREHAAMVRGAVPDKEKLLEWTVQDGWEPLCEFLGEDVPKIEFPSGNATKETTVRLERMRARIASQALKNVGLLGAGLAGIIAVVWLWII